MSLTRTAFLLLAVIYFMPTPPEPAAQQTDLSAQPVAAPQLVDAATNVFSDATEFCGRQPAVCVTAGHLMHKLEAKAKYSMRLLYEWANESGTTVPDAAALPLRNEAVADPLTTSSTFSKVAGETGISTGTLTIEDLIPEWRGPQSVRKS